MSPIRRFRRIVAVFLIINILAASLPPEVLALTSGPTAPEATSFEPVDTTDMVNLSTGDFTYNVPLIEIPGPAGSYPLGLSYHAGIQPGEDASWVGLGWTLNPGAITRMVNGYADDYSGVMTRDRSFWEGGHQTTVTVGVSVGIGEFATVSAGLEVSHDTFRGTGVGGYLGVAVGPQTSVSPNANVRVGISPYGGTYASAGIGLSIGKSTEKGLTGSLNVGLDISSSGIHASAGGGVGFQKPGPKKADGSPGEPASPHYSLMDASIATGSSKPSLSVGGGSVGVFNSKAGVVSTHSKNFQVDIPVWYGVNIHLGRSYVRYWSDETTINKLYGTLFMHNLGSYGLADAAAYDTYSTFDQTIPLDNNYSTDEVATATFPDYDYYNVAAQGVSGSMRPYHYFSSVRRQNQRPDGQPYNVKMYEKGGTQTYTNSKVEYHFENEFANSVTSSPTGMSVTMDAGAPYTFDNYTATTGLNGDHTIPNVPGGKHIEWFSNLDMAATPEIMSNEGFLDCTAAGFTRLDDDANGKVGGFRITNTSGVTYHFSLPAYSYNEYTYSGNKTDATGATFNLLTNPVRYAYTWYLTAVTGPDFIDRNGNALADSGDWGYWVTFNYGKWTDRYQWRTPGEDSNEDTDSNFKTFSKGVKELYYLNSVATATHTAVFEKEIRYDGKGVTEDRPDAAIVAGDHTLGYINAGGYDPKDNLTPGGFKNYPASPMKLNAIYVLKNEDVPSNLLTAGTRYTSNFTSGAPHDLHNGNYVFDDSDKAALGAITSNAIRAIRLETDYSLEPYTPNSYKSYFDIMNTGQPENLANKLGKLTLNKLQFLGKQCFSSLPKTTFIYDLPDEKDFNGSVSHYLFSRSLTISLYLAGGEQFNVGDFVTFSDNTIGAKYYGTIVSEDEPNDKINVLLSSATSLFLGSVAKGIKRTKNPPYVKDGTDIWGAFKSDYLGVPNAAYNGAHSTTEVSSHNVDAWSLRSIKTPTGSQIDIDYGSDRYDGTQVFHQALGGDLTFVRDPVGFAPGIYLQGDSPGAGYAVNSEVSTVAVYQVHDGILNTMATCYGGIVMQNDPDTDNGFLIQTSISTHNPSVTYTLYSGYLVPGRPDMPGGGIRVNSVTVSSAYPERSSTTSYEYEGGITPYEPVHSGSYELGTNDDIVNAYFKTAVASSFITLLTIAREIPPPNVTYGKVRVKEKFLNEKQEETAVKQYTEYAFQTFDTDMIKPISYSNYTAANTGTYVAPATIDNTSGASLHYTSETLRRVGLRNFTMSMGSLKSITLYDENDNKISETINHYLTDELSPPASFDAPSYETLLARYNKQGLIKEVFNYGKLVKSHSSSDYTMMGVVSQRETYPAIQTGTTSTNYITGITTETKTTAFDFYSGESTETISTDSYGNAFLAETVPAYTKYTGMGFKEHQQFGMSNDSRAHMLSQLASSSTYKITSTTDKTRVGVVSSQATTWMTDASPVGGTTTKPLWRPRTNVVYVGDLTQSIAGNGIRSYSGFSPYTSWSAGGAQTGWQVQTELTKGDIYSHGLEEKTGVGIYSSSKMSANNRIILCTTANSRYDEMAYSGAEDEISGTFGGGVQRGTSVSKFQKTSPTDTTTTHTGDYALRLSALQQGFVYQFTASAGRQYRASVWTNSADGQLAYTVDGVAGTPGVTIPTRKSGAWYQVEVIIPAGTTIKVWSTLPAGANPGNFDDFRVHPVDAFMTSYVYNSWGELSHVLDANNLYTEYRYNPEGNINEVYKESFAFKQKRVSKIVYTYANQ